MIKKRFVTALRLCMRTTCAGVLAWIAAIPSLPASGETIIRMPSGGYRNIEPSRPFEQVINRSPDVLAVDENKANHSFRIRAIAPGEGVVELHGTDGRGNASVRSFRVVARDSQNQDDRAPSQKNSEGALGAPDLATWISQSFKGLRASTIGDSILLSGSILSLGDFRRLEQLALSSGAAFVPQYQIAPALLEEILADINRRLSSGTGASLSLIRSGSSIVATTDDATNKKVERLIRRYAMILPSFDDDRSGNPYPDSQIKVTMHFVESNDNKATESGQRFSGAHYPLTGQISSNGGVEQAPFQFYLRYLSAHLSTRLLEQPVIMAQSGTTAELHSGGDLAYQASVSEHGQATQFRSYGLTAKVSPRTRHDGDIKLDIDLEISDPSGSEINAINQTLNTRRVKSSMVLQDGMARLIARLKRQKRDSSAASPPLFAKIPVISWLTSSRGNSSKVQDLWIFVSATSDLYQPFDDSLEALNNVTLEQ